MEKGTAKFTVTKFDIHGTKIAKTYFFNSDDKKQLIRTKKSSNITLFCDEISD